MWHLFGERPTPFHLIDLSFHLATCLLVVALGERLKLSTSASWTAAVVFAVHPGHLESVAWIAALKDPMYTSFLLAAVLCYARSIDRQRRFASPATIAFLTMSLLCKSMGFIAPVLFLLVERLASTPSPRRVIAWRLLGPSIVCVGFLLHFPWVAHANGVIIPPPRGHLGSPRHFLAVGVHPVSAASRCSL